MKHGLWIGLSKFGRHLWEIAELYRPARCSDSRGNFVWLIAMIISYPSGFIMPVITLLVKWLRVRTLRSFFALLYAVIHLLASPLIVLYLIALPFLGCRLYAQTPAGLAMLDIQRKMRAQVRD